LFYHMWDEKTKKHSPCFWGRGNGWVVMAYTEVLKNEMKGSQDAEKLIAAFKKQLAEIVSLQDPKTGLWRTVLDEPDTYVEVSGSAMILYGLLECRNLKLFDVPYTEAMRRGWAGLAKNLNSKGYVTGVSDGTGPGDKENYQSKSTGTFRWGTGAFLLAACAYAESDLYSP